MALGMVAVEDDHDGLDHRRLAYRLGDDVG